MFFHVLFIFSFNTLLAWNYLSGMNEFLKTGETISETKCRSLKPLNVVSIQYRFVQRYEMKIDN